MQFQDPNRESAGAARRRWAPWLLLLLGMLIGAVAQPGRWLPSVWFVSPVENTQGRAETVSPAPGALTGKGANDLDSLSLEVPPKTMEALEAVRRSGLDSGIIKQDDAMYPATVNFKGESMDAKVRIKGDVSDHVETDKWSLRIQISVGGVMGMRQFSIQNPETRGYLWEWFFLEACRREGVLAPRSTFINVSINGQNKGIYFLEEHMAKELLESQQRREGPIVRFDEDTLWSLRQDNHFLTYDLQMRVPATAGMVNRAIESAVLGAFGEGRLSGAQGLARSLDRSIEQLDNLEKSFIAADKPGNDDRFTPRIKILEAQRDLQGKTIDGALDTVHMARAHALASLFRVYHSLNWHNLRFYYNPVIDRLEPIMFDNEPQFAAESGLVPFRGDFLTDQLRDSDAYYQEFYRSMGRLIQPDYYAGLQRDLGPKMQRYADAMSAEFTLPDYGAPPALWERVREEQINLSKSVQPADPINFTAAADFTGPDEKTKMTKKAGPSLKTESASMLEVEAWATTLSPVVIESFEFANGSVVYPRPYLDEKERAAVSMDGEHGVVAPYDGRHLVFRLPMDERLESLSSVKAIKRSIRAQAEEEPARPALKARYHLLAEKDSHVEKLQFRRRDEAWRSEGSRPPAPTLSAFLADHAYASYHSDTDDIWIEPGVWQVDGDLVVPDGVTLNVAAGAKLQFSPLNALICTGALHLHGAADAPVVLEPKAGFDEWRGINIMKAGQTSIWDHAVIRQTKALARSGWQVTGGVTFFQCGLNATDCHFDGSKAEDGINVFGARVEFERVEMSGCVSDSFDGDFMSGFLHDCYIHDGLADAIDLSGSDLEVSNCRFVNLGDKGFSIGEVSKIKARNNVCVNCGIGAAIKDGSTGDFDGLTIDHPRSFGVAAYIKKPVYNPSRATFKNTKIILNPGGVPSPAPPGAAWQMQERVKVVRPSIAQTNSEIELNGEKLPTEPIDVDKMYAEKILGT